MNVIIDEVVLEQARKIADKRTYSDVINFALSEIVRHDKLAKAIYDLAATPNAFPGGLQALMRMRTDPDLPKGRRVAAKSARMPKRQAKKRASHR